MADRELLKLFVMKQLDLKYTSGNRKEVDMVLALEWQFNKDKWMAAYEKELDEMRFTNNETVVLSEFVERFHGLVERNVIPGVSLSTIQCRVSATAQSRIALLIDIDSTKFVK